MANIEVVNIRSTGLAAVEYLGRGGKGVKGSPLANPRRLKDGWDRGEALVHYEPELRAALDRTVAFARWNGKLLTEGQREEMRAEMNRLYRAASDNGRIRLGCFCAPDACHGDSVKKLLLEALASVR